MSVLKNASRYHATTIDEGCYATLLSLLSSVDPQSSFPVVDLLRLTSLHPTSSQRSRLPYWRNALDSVLENMEKVPKEDVPVRMLGYRLACNLLKVRAFYGTDLWSKERVGALCAALDWPSAGKNVKSSGEKRFIATFAARPTPTFFAR